MTAVELDRRRLRLESAQANAADERFVVGASRR